MAELTHIFAEDNTGGSHTGDTNYQAGLTISGASIAASTKYLIICQALVKINSTTQKMRARLNADDSNLFTTGGLLKSRLYMESAVSDEWFVYSYCHQYTSDGTPGDVYLEYSTPQSSGSTVSWEQERIFMLDLDQFGTGETDYWEDVQARDTGTEYSTSSQTTILAEIDAATQHGSTPVVVLGSAMTDIGTATLSHDVELRSNIDDTSRITRGFYEREGEDANEQHVQMFVSRHEDSGGTDDITIYGSEESTSANAFDGGAYLLAIPESEFADVAWEWASSGSLTTSESTLLSNSFTPTADGKHLILYHAYGAFGQAPDSFALHIELDSVVTPTGEDLDNHMTHDWDSTDNSAITGFAYADITGLTTVALRGISEASLNVLAATLVIISLDDGVAGGTTVTPTVFAANYALPAATPQGQGASSPAVFAANYALPAATALGKAVSTPSVFTADYALPAATVTVAKTVTPSVFAADYTLPAATPLGAALTTPSAFVADYALPAVSVAVSKTVTPGVFVADYALPAASVLAASVVTPSVFIADYALGAATASVSKVVTPGVFVADYALPSATAVGAGITTPSVFVADYAIPAVTISVGKTVTPGVFIADYTLPAATPLAASVVTPGVFVSDYALPAATVVVAGGVVTPGVFIADFALPAATALGAGLVTPSVFVAPYTLPAATTLAGVLTTPAVFAADWSVLTITRYGVIVQTITAPESASLYRLPGANPRLVVGMGPRRSMTVGLNSREGWERVSEQFKMNGTTEGIAEIDVALEAVWATHSGSAAATLKAAIDSALNTYGFRRGDGSSLV